jgi:hypothetical protein
MAAIQGRIRPKLAEFAKNLATLGAAVVAMGVGVAVKERKNRKIERGPAMPKSDGTGKKGKIGKKQG